MHLAEREIDLVPSFLVMLNDVICMPLMSKLWMVHMTDKHCRNGDGQPLLSE